MLEHGLLERDEALGTIFKCVTTASSGMGSVVLVSGEAGVGKSTMIMEFARRHAKLAQLFVGYCDASNTPLPLGPVFDFAESLGPQIVEMMHSGEATSALFPAIMKRLHDSKLPIVMVIEDLHWADRATLDLVRYLGRRVVASRFVMILSFRNDEVGVDHPLTAVLGDLPASSVSRIVLKPLSEKAVAQISGAEGKSLLKLYELTDGNPLFLTELLAHGQPDGPLPASIRDAVWARLSRTSDLERQALYNLSIVPVPIEPELVIALAGDNQTNIANLVRRGLLRELSNGNLIFRHELARLATLEAIEPDRLRELHESAENVLVQMQSADVAGILTRRVHHADGAGNANKILELAPLAAAEAKRLGAHEQAAALLGQALSYVKLAAPEQAAQLYEDWSYEVGLSKNIGEDVIAARQKAVELWQQLGRPEKVSKNYRWLWRLHWYRGEAEKAQEYIEKAEAVLAGCKPGPDLAMAYSVRSQTLMLRDENEAAIEWGQKAISLAQQIGDIESLTHALNNVGTAMLAIGNLDGKTYLGESLNIALANGLHEQAARAYTNFSEAALNNREFALAERLFKEGIAFDIRHDLDAWTHYLSGGFARLRVEQGRFGEADIMCTGILSLERQTLIMKLPAKIALGFARIRLGSSDGEMLLQQSLEDGFATSEPQYILPSYLGLTEAAWLAGDELKASAYLEKAIAVGGNLANFRYIGDIQVWSKRLGLAYEQNDLLKEIFQPYAAELAGEFAAAAKAWDQVGSPYQAAMSLAHSNNLQELVEALRLFQKIGAKAASHFVRQRAELLGFTDLLPKPTRGPYKAARQHPLGLTEKEVRVLALLSEGQGNHQIAAQLNRSRRTIEHQVGSVLTKLNARNRVEVILRMQTEPWLLYGAN
jgi:DNA-binding CsgD family transcriptional regulator/Tfp pilus assembly protein PilF